MNENIRIRTHFSWQLSSLLLGRMFYVVASVEPAAETDGTLLLVARGGIPEILPDPGIVEKPMRNLLVFIGFIILALSLYGIWGNLNSKLIAIESKTGSYLPTPLIETYFDDSSLLENWPGRNRGSRKTRVQSTPFWTSSNKCRRRAANRVVSREVIYFGHNRRELESTEMAKIDRLLKMSRTTRSYRCAGMQIPALTVATTISCRCVGRRLSRITSIKNWLNMNCRQT